MKAFLVGLMLCAAAMAQGPNSGSVVRVNAYPSNEPSQHFFYPSATVHYVCVANPVGPSNATNPNGYYHVWSVAASTVTNIVVSSNTATITWASPYGLVIGNEIVISGSTTSALNGTYNVLTTPSSTTATITTSGVSDGTYTTGIVISTRAPAEIDSAWSIELIQLDASGNTISTGWGWNRSNQGGAGGYNLPCSNRATTTGASAISYR